MWGRKGVTWESGVELEDIHSTAEYGGHLRFTGNDEGALKLRRSAAAETGGSSFGLRIMEFAGGDVYEGELEAGLKHGQGTYKWGNGARYEGQWKDNAPSGMGKYTWPDGESYEGGFKYGRREGSGIYTFSDGASFVGVFADDQPRGKGICTLPGGRCFHGDYSLFEAYLRATRALRGKKGKDPWIHDKWSESADLLRNPPWAGFNAVRPGSRHYEEGFSVFRDRKFAPAVASRTFAIDWPHPLQNADALDLHSQRPVRRRRVPKHVLSEWPRIKQPPRAGDEDEISAAVEEEEDQWKVGDVCECEDMVGASMVSLGRPEIPGRIEPKPPGMYWKVKIDQVEHVWPGFTESKYPLTICKVSYIGCSEKPQEWVQSRRLRPAKAVRVEGNPQWKGWAVHEKAGAVGEYKPEVFVPFDGLIQVGDHVECLFPFSGRKRAKEKARYLGDLDPPRMLDVAIKSSICVMMEEGDPSGKGMWECATPPMLGSLPKLMCSAERWTDLADRVLGSLSFMAQVNLELGPDALCLMLDESRVAMAQAGKVVPTEVVQTISMHREFAHMHRNRMRTVPLARIAKECALPCEEAANDYMLGQTGVVNTAETYMREAVPGETCDVELLEGAKRLMELCMRLGMLDMERMRACWEEASLFIEGNEPSQYSQSGQRRECRDRGIVNPNLKRKAVSSRLVCDALSKLFRGTRPKVEAPSVLRIILDVRYDPAKNSTVRSRVIAFLCSHPSLSDGSLRAIRVEMGHTRDCNCDWDTTEIFVTVNLPPGKDARDACMQVVADFQATSMPFSTVCRTTYAMKEICLLFESCFVSLVYASTAKLHESDAVLGFTARWRGIVEGGEEELEQVWHCQMLRQDVADALELPRENVRVVAVGACSMRAIIELVCPHGQAPPAVLHRKAEVMVQRILKGESVFEGGRPVALYENALSATLTTGHVPPSLPGDWRSVRVYNTLMGPDVHADGVCAATLALPTLRKVLQQARVALSWTAPGLSGIAQNTHVSASSRLSRMQDCFIPLAHGDRVRMNLVFLAERAGRAPRALAWVVEGHDEFAVRVWAGDVRETRGQQRGQGLEHTEVTTTVKLPLGEYSVDEFAAALENGLDGAKWTGGYIESASRSGAPMPFKWHVIVDMEGRITIRLNAESFYRFELSFKSSTLAALVGFYEGRRGPNVRQDEGLVVTGSLPVREGSPGVWFCEATASVCWQQAEELQACAYAGFGFCTKNPWARLGSSGLEIAEGCLLQPFGAEVSLFVRSNSFVKGRHWDTAVSDLQVPASAVAGLIGDGSEAEELANRELSSAVRRYASSGVGSVCEHEGIFEGYEYPSHVTYSKYVILKKEVESRLKEWNDLRTKMRLEWRAEGRADVVDGRIELDREEWFGVYRMGGDKQRDIDALRRECFAWWTLLREEHGYMAKGHCFHSKNIEFCFGQPCMAIKEAVVDKSMLDWEAEFAERRYSPARVCDRAAKGLTFDTDSLERSIMERACASILAHVPLPSPTAPPLPSLPYNSHILLRASHSLASLALSEHYIAPYGGTRDNVCAQLERLTSGPPASRVPVVLLSGPPHSGRSSSLAHFHRTSQRCTAQRRLDHSVSAQPVFPNAGRGVGGAVWDRGDQPGVIVSAFVGGGRSSLREALEFAALEIAVQTKGPEALGAGQEETSKHTVGHLLSISEEELLEDARVKFSAEVTHALRDGLCVLVLVDGLNNKEVEFLAKEVTSLHSNVASQIRRTNAHTEDACVQCVLTCEGEMSGAQGRLVQILPLDDTERMLIARQRLGLYCCEDGDEDLGGVTCEEIARLVSDKEDAFLPLMIVACAHEAARFVRDDEAHRTFDSSGSVRRADAVRKHVLDLPQEMIPLLSDQLLSSLEERYGYLTVMWTMLHLTLHPKGISLHDLRDHVRESLLRILLHVDSALPDRHRYLLLIGSPEDPEFLLDACTQDILWDHRRNGQKEFTTWYTMCRPPPGVFWCTDAELDGILFAISPFLRKGRSTQVPSFSNSEHDEIIAMHHEQLRAAVVFRYDNPGSIRSIPDKAEDGKGIDSPLAPIESLSIAQIRDAHDVLRVPLGTTAPTRIPSAHKLQMSGKALAVVPQNGKRKGLAKKGSDLMGIGALEYEQSAMRGEDVTTFYKTLDDNCVWHLHHLDQVLCLFPGGSMHVSRARFRPRIIKREILLGRFPAERDLLFLLSGRCRKDGAHLVAIDLAKRGNRFIVRGVRDGVHLGEPCLFFAGNDFMNKSTARFDFGDAEELDELSLQRANFSGRTSDLSRDFEDGKVGGFGICADLCLTSPGENFVLSGGTGVVAWDSYDDYKKRMAHDPEDGELFQYRKHKVFVRRRGMTIERPKPTPSKISIPPRTREELRKLATPLSIIDVDTGQELWRASQPWFGIRVGQAYVLQVEGAGRGSVRSLCDECNGTVHDPDAGDSWHNVHFYYKEDCDLAWRIFQSRGIGVRESRGMHGRKVVSVLVKLQTQSKESHWGGGAGMSAVLYPPRSDTFLWNCSFDLDVERDAWQALAVSVDPLTGVCVCVKGRTAGRVALPRAVSLFIDMKDAKFSVGDYSCYGAFDGFMKNVAFYKRGFTIAEMQAMTKRGPPSKMLADDSYKEATDLAKGTSGEEKVSGGKEDEKKPRDEYRELIQSHEPWGFWPLDESEGIDCYDQAVKSESEAADDLLSQLGVGKDKQVVQVSKDQKKVLVRNLVYESKHKGSVVKGKRGPKMFSAEGGGTSVQIQGGGIRSSEGSLCVEKKEEGAGGAQTKKVPTEWKDFTVEVWLQRTSLYFNANETIMSYNSETAPINGSVWWFFEETGKLNFRIEGECRAVGPCPAVRIDDLNWHHIAVTRTSDEEEVNNWSFFVDGERVWTTRYDGHPTAQPLGTLLLGRRHGEHWGPSRMWRSGVGDPTCLQANICNFAFYNRALPADIIKRHFEFDPQENVAAPKAPVAEITKAPGAGVLERVTDKVKGIISAHRGLVESTKPAGPSGFPSMSSVVVGAGKKASREKILIEKSKFAALRHRPSVWGNVPKLSATDVDAFFGALENNPIWSMTRKSTAIATQQHNMQISQGSAVGSTVTIRTLPNPSNKTPCSKIESAHALAADTLMASGDPSKSGTWENSSPSLLAAVVHHACMSRRWGDLERCVCSLFFLGSCVREFGLVGLRKLLGEAVAALDESNDQGDDASSCRSILAIHYDFFQQYLIARSGEVNMRALWGEAQSESLPGVEICIGMCGQIVDRCRHLLASADLPSVIPIEITAYRLLRTLRKIKQLSLEFLCPDALVGMPQTIHGIDHILDEMNVWLSSKRDSFQSVAVKRFADLATYDDSALAVDNAALLLRPFFDISEVPDRVRILLKSQIPCTRSGKEALACKLLRAAGSPHAVIVRMEEGLRIQSVGATDGQGVVVLTCPSEVLADVASKVQALDEVEIADEVVTQSCFLSFWIAHAGQWRGPKRAIEGIFYDLSEVKKQTTSLQNGRFTMHVVRVSEGGGFCCVELWGEGAWEAAEEICSQVRVEGSALMQGSATRRISAALASRGFMPPGPAGEYMPANLFVSSALFDMSAERRFLGEVLFPAMQAVLRDFRVHMTFTDLRFGGPCQTFAQEHEGLSPNVTSLERSVLATPSNTLNTPWVLLLLGHHVGVRHPKDSPERLALERTHPWTAQHQRSTAVEIESKRALPPAMEGAAPCVSSVLMRGARLVSHESFARLLPASARAAYTEGGVEGENTVSALREAATRAGAVVYETKVLGYRCPVEVVISRVRELHALLEEDLRAMRGWPDLGEEERSAGEYRHRMSGLLRTRADEVTVRMRAVVADRKAELMKWWLLLREEDERTRGETGIGRHGGMEALSELRRIAREQDFVQLLYEGVGGGTRGILDSDGFVCPSMGSAGVAAQGAQLDMGPFSVAFARAFVARAVALFDMGDESHAPLSATSVWARGRERQGRIMRAFALGWMEPLTEVCGGQAMAAEELTVVSKEEFSKGVGKIERTVESLGVQWVSGLRGQKKIFESEVFSFNGERKPPKGYDPPQTICLAPIRTEELVLIEQFSRSHPGRPVLLVQGAPCSGKSTLLACLVNRKELGVEVAPGIPLSRAGFGVTPVLLSFHFSTGDGSSAADVLCYLAEDIEAQVVGAGAGWERAGTLAGTVEGSLQEARRRLACAVMRAACSQGAGASVLLVVDGLRGPDVERVCECVHRIEWELLQEVRRSLQRDVCVKLIVSCDLVTRKMRELVPDEQDVVSLLDLAQTEIRGLAGHHLCHFTRLAEPLPKDCLAVFAEKEGSKCPLYVSALVHASRHFKEEGSKGLVAMAERPDGIVKLFQEGILPRLEVLHGRLLVETLVLQLLACPRGVPYSQLKIIVCSGVKIAGGSVMKGRVAYADMEFEGVMEGLRPYLLPRRGDEDDFICLEHNLLRAAAQRRYDPAAPPIWEEEKEEDAKEVVARALEAKKKKQNEEDLDGYAWVRATVWQAPGDDLQVQVEYHVTSESALSVANHAMFHIRKLLQPKQEQKRKLAAAEVVEVAKGTTLSRPGFVAKVPRGLGQAWPFVDEGYEEDATQRMLLSKAQHPDDASHMRAMLIRGFPPVPEKKYALTAHSAQSQVRASARKQKDRWSSTGGINPGPAYGTYPPKREVRPNTIRMPAAVRSLAANWGQPLSAPAIPPGGTEAVLRGTGKLRAPAVPRVPLASGDDRGALRRSASYTRQRQADIFGR